MSVSMDWNGDEALAAILAAAERGVGKALDGLLDASQEEVPVDDADLRDSGRTSQDGLEGAVSYDTAYAVLRHESGYAELNNGRRKFLERPFVGRRGQWLETIADEIRPVID